MKAYASLTWFLRCHIALPSVFLQTKIAKYLSLLIKIGCKLFRLEGKCPVHLHVSHCSGDFSLISLQSCKEVSHLYIIVTGMVYAGKFLWSFPTIGTIGLSLILTRCQNMKHCHTRLHETTAQDHKAWGILPLSSLSVYPSWPILFLLIWYWTALVVLEDPLFISMVVKGVSPLCSKIEAILSPWENSIVLF